MRRPLVGHVVAVIARIIDDAGTQDGEIDQAHRLRLPLPAEKGEERGHHRLHPLDVLLDFSAQGTILDRLVAAGLLEAYTPEIPAGDLRRLDDDMRITEAALALAETGGSA